MNNGAIGIFDSGLGGISVLNKCVKLIPNENFIYYADSKNAPYGDKTAEEIILLTKEAIDSFFIKKNIKILVIACNTATNAAIDSLREIYDFPIIGIEPAIRPALLNCEDGYKTLILATEATVSSVRFKNKLHKFDSNKYITLACSGLVEFIEAEDKVSILNYLKNKIKKEGINNLSSVVLGCTHYPFIKEELISVLGSDVLFYDGGEGVAKRLFNVLEENDLFSDFKLLSHNIEINSSKNKEYNDKLKKYLEV